MSDTFGDLEADDVFGTEPADPEQVARKLLELRREHGDVLPPWDGLTPGERVRHILIVAGLLEWGRRQGVFR